MATARRRLALEKALEAVSVTVENFGTLRTTLDAIDPQSAARLLAYPEKIEAYAMLTAEEASILELMGDATRVKSGYRRALSLYLEAVLLELTISDDASAAISELRSKVDENKLPDRYQDALAARGT